MALMVLLMPMTAMSIDIMLPALPEIGASLGVSDTAELPLVVTIFMVGMAIGQLVWGPLADRFGRRKSDTRAARSEERARQRAIKQRTLDELLNDGISCSVCHQHRGKAAPGQGGLAVYQKAFAKGLAWIPAGHILRMSPPIVMEDEVLLKGLDIIDESIGETAVEMGYA